MAKRSFVSQLAAMGEGAINKNILGGGITQRALEGALSLKDRVEGVVKGLAEVEARVAVLEERVEKLEKPAPKRAPRKAAAASTAAAKKPAPKATSSRAPAAKPPAAKTRAKKPAS